MDKISDKQKLLWLTTPLAARKRAMINKNSPPYKITQLRPQAHQPSFGILGTLPPELWCMVFRHLTCDDLEALHSCSTGGRIAILAFPQYHALLKHAPTLLAVLKETGLARSFTITQIYETFTSPLCTTCGQFGGYVFLPSFTRCCMHCVETELKFLPISRTGAMHEFGVKKKILDSLPQLSSIEGYYSSSQGEIKYYTHHVNLFSRELIEKVRNPKKPLPSGLRSQRYLGDTSIQAHERYMALAPLPCFLPKSASIERGLYCLGCDTRAREHAGSSCLGTRLSEYREYKPILEHITDGKGARCRLLGRAHDQCRLITERDRLYDSRHILSHIQSCAAAQALLKRKWTRSQERVSAGEKKRFVFDRKKPRPY